MIDAARGAIDIGWYNREAPFFTEYGSATPSDLQSKGDTYGHFTQLVWKESSRLGCASYLCAPGTIKKDYQAWNTVCNYDPPGMKSYFCRGDLKHHNRFGSLLLMFAKGTSMGILRKMC